MNKIFLFFHKGGFYWVPRPRLLALLDGAGMWLVSQKETAELLGDGKFS